MGLIIRGFIWDIPILIFAYVLFWGPGVGVQSLARFKGRCLKVFRLGGAESLVSAVMKAEM